MQPRNQPARKGGQQPRRRDPEQRRLLSVRSALVLTLALSTALGGAVLLYEAHRPVPLIVLGAVGIFAAALKLLRSVRDFARKEWPLRGSPTWRPDIADRRHRSGEHHPPTPPFGPSRGRGSA